MRKLYFKNKLMIRLSKPFENKRLFTPLQLSIYTLKDFKLWPEKLIALDAFCQTGLQWTRIFYHQAEYLEMWDIDSEALKYAKKEFPKATITCGDSIAAIKNKLFKRSDFNFVLIDSPVPFQYPNGTFEHFDFFEQIFKNTANNCVLIFDVVPDINKMLSRHPHSPEFVKEWERARSAFYNSTKGDEINPSKMIDEYRKKVESLDYKIKLLTYNARNEYFGFITLAVSK